MNKKNVAALMVLVVLVVSVGTCQARPKVLCFGDSITRAASVKGNGWVDLLSKRHLNYDFVNSGRAGRKTNNFNELTKAIDEHSDSEIVLIFLGVNDLKHATDQKVSDCVKNISSMIDDINTKIPQAKILLLAPTSVNEKDMSKINIDKDYTDNTQNCLVKMAKEYEKLADQSKISFLSLLNVVSPENFNDGLHPNAAGHVQLAEYISKNVFMPTDDIPAGLKDKGLTLIWHDEFEGDKIDQSKWTISGDSKRRDGYWHKSECYLDGIGNLIIRTSKYGDKYVSGHVGTRGKFDYKFGYMVARCKFPSEQGHWPGFWLQSDAMGEIGNGGTDGSEIDIMEKPHYDKDLIAQTLHWDGYSKEHHKSAYNGYEQQGITKGWHTFGLYWTKDEYVYYVDGKETWRTKAGGVSQVAEFVRFSEEIAAFTGDITKATLPDYFTVDYVRLYDKP